MTDDWRNNSGLSTGEQVKAIVVSAMVIALTIFLGGLLISGEENAGELAMIGGAVALLGIIAGMFVYWKSRSEEDGLTTLERAVFVLIGGFVLAAICYGLGRRIWGEAGSEVFGTISGTLSVLGIVWAVVLFRKADREGSATESTEDNGQSVWEAIVTRVVVSGVLIGIGGMLIGCGYQPAFILGACLFLTALALLLIQLGATHSLEKRTTRVGKAGAVAGWYILLAGVVCVIVQKLHPPLLAVGMGAIPGAVVLLAVAAFWEKTFLDRFTVFGKLLTSLCALAVLGFCWYEIGLFTAEQYVWMVKHPDPKKFFADKQLTKRREEMLDFEGLVERLEEKPAVRGTVFPIWKDPQQGFIVTQPEKDVRVFGVWVGTVPDNHDGRCADPIYSLLSPRLRAPDRESADIIVWVDHVHAPVAHYERGATAFRQDIQIQLIDKTIPAIVHHKTIKGPGKPILPKTTGSYRIGKPPYREVADYLERLFQPTTDTQESTERVLKN